MLHHHYCMHEDIAAFLSEQFYSSKLKIPKSIKSQFVAWSQHPFFPTVEFWNVHRKHVTNSSTGHGFKNEQEAYFIMGIIQKIFFTRSDQQISVGIISFYKGKMILFYSTQQRKKVGIRFYTSFFCLYTAQIPEKSYSKMYTVNFENRLLKWLLYTSHIPIRFYTVSYTASSFFCSRIPFTYRFSWRIPTVYRSSIFDNVFFLTWIVISMKTDLYS